MGSGPSKFENIVDKTTEKLTKQQISHTQKIASLKIEIAKLEKKLSINQNKGMNQKILNQKQGALTTKRDELEELERLSRNFRMKSNARKESIKKIKEMKLPNVT